MGLWGSAFISQNGTNPLTLRRLQESALKQRQVVMEISLLDTAAMSRKKRSGHDFLFNLDDDDGHARLVKSAIMARQHLRSGVI